MVPSQCEALDGGYALERDSRISWLSIITLPAVAVSEDTIIEVLVAIGTRGSGLLAVAVDSTHSIRAARIGTRGKDVGPLRSRCQVVSRKAVGVCDFRQLDEGGR